jgi:hypothetical protein
LLTKTHAQKITLPALSVPTLPKPAQYPPQSDHRPYNDSRQFKDGNLVPLTGHDSQSSRRAFEAGGHGGEGLGSGVDDALVAGIVVDVDGDGAELRDFGLEGGEGVVVLSVA